MLSLAVTATSGPTASRTVRSTVRAKRARFSTEPPNWSSRRLSLGLKNALEEVVVPDVHLDGIEAGLHRQRGGPPVVLGDALDPGHVDGVQARAHGREAAGGREGRGTVGARVGDRPGVADLRGGRGALGVDRVGEPAQAGDGVLVQEEAVPVGPPLGGDGEVGHGGHGGAAGRHPAVELDQLVADDAARHDALEGGRLDDAVAQCDRPEAGRAEDLGRGRAGGAWHGPTFAERRAGRTIDLSPDRSAAASDGSSGGPLTPQCQVGSAASAHRRCPARGAGGVADGQRRDDPAGGADDRPR